jgi:hypothetical protein
MTTGLSASDAAVVAQYGVLLPMHLRLQGAEGVTIALARAPPLEAHRWQRCPCHPP